MGKESRYRFKDNIWGIWGWLGNMRFNLERYLYLIHRVTGIGLILFLSLHIIVTSSRMYGESAWIQTEAITKNPIYDLGMLFVIAGLIFHGLNGIRLILHEYGILLGKPKQQVYPYRPALKGRWPRTVIIIMLIIGLLLLTITLYEFLTVWGVMS